MSLRLPNAPAKYDQDAQQRMQSMLEAADRQNLKLIGKSSLVTQFAGPTATVGLNVENGVATTAMRSDAAPALDVSISPTWTGNHVFDNSVGIGAAPNRKLDIDNGLSAAGLGSVRVLGYQAAFEVFNRAGTANWYFGNNDADGNKLYIGRGYGPNQGILPSLTIDQSGNGNATFNGNLTVHAQVVANQIMNTGFIMPGVAGVVGDGVTDDTAAIQAILDAYDNVLIAKGRYLISKTLTISTNRSRIIQGAGPGVFGTGAVEGTIFVASASWNTSLGVEAIAVSGTAGSGSNYSISNFTVVNQTQGVGASYGILVNTQYGRIKNLFHKVQSSGFQINWLIQDTGMVTYSLCTAYSLDSAGHNTSNEVAVYMLQTGPTAVFPFCGDSDFVECVFRTSPSGICVTITDQGVANCAFAGIRFRACLFYENYYGLYVALSGANSYCQDLWMIDGSQFDGSCNNGGACIYLNAAGTGSCQIGDVHIAGLYFSTANIGNHVVGRLANGGNFHNIQIHDNYMINAGGATIDLRATGGTGRGITCTDNILSGPNTNGSICLYFEAFDTITCSDNTGHTWVSQGSWFAQLNQAGAAVDWFMATGNNSGGCGTGAGGVSISGSVTHATFANNQ